MQEQSSPLSPERKALKETKRDFGLVLFNITNNDFLITLKFKIIVNNS
jgi:hypothetical protein